MKVYFSSTKTNASTAPSILVIKFVFKTKQRRQKLPKMDNFNHVYFYNFFPPAGNQKTKTLKNFTLLLGLLFLFQITSFGQGHLQVTIQDGTSTTTCDDIFNAPDPFFSVRVNGNNWETYPGNQFCFTELPYMQYEAFYSCPSDVPTTVNLCLRVFENDGLFCNLDEQCMVEVCQDFNIPAPGTSVDYTFEIIDGLASDGTIDFTVELDDSFVGGQNDFVCDAVDLGVLSYVGTIGDGTLSNYNNYCSSNTNEPNPINEGGVFGNGGGVWFTFMTDDTPSALNFINTFSDPEGLGDEIALEVAIYESTDGTCNNLNLLYSAYDASSGLDQSVIAHCLSPNSRYYILVDAAFIPGTGGTIGVEGLFGIEVTSVGIVEPPDFRCDAEDLGMVPNGGSVGTPMDQTNFCGTDLGEPNPTAFQLQRTVWYMFQAPESGHVVVDITSDNPNFLGIDSIDAQLAVYRSGSNSCIGPMIELESSYTPADLDESIELQCLVPGDNYWAIIDGSGNNTMGIFSITVSDAGPVPPQSTTVLDEVVCGGGSLLVGDSLYTESGSVEQLILAANGCDSLVTGFVTILDPISTTIDTVICNGESVAIGNSIYFDTGNYSDVFTTSQSCDSIVYTNVTVLESVQAVAIQLQEASDITASDGSVTVNVTGGTGPYTYLWSNNSTNQTINNLSPGLYCVTVTAVNGCEDVTCISVLYPGAISVDVENGQVSCPGDSDGVLTLTVSDGMPAYNYEWGVDFGTAQGSGTINNPGESATINNLAPGTNYTITVTDGDGLIIVTFGEITEPQPIVNNLDTTLCFGETLMVGNTTYSTSGPILENLTSALGCDSLVTGTLIILDDITTNLDLTECFGTTITVGTADYTTTGPINEILTAQNGCDSTVTGFLTILPEIVTDQDFTLCFGESVNVGNSTYASSGDFVDVLPAANGCDSTINTSVIILNELIVSANLVTEASGLGAADGVAEAVAMGGSGNYSYSWSNASAGNVASNLTGGQTYCVTVTDDTNCSAEDCVVILFPVDIQSAFINDTLDCPGDTNGTLTFTAFNGQAPYNYTWQNADNSLNGSGDVLVEGGTTTVDNLPAGVYSIEISDQWGSGFFTIEIIEADPIVITLENQTDASCFGECNGSLEVSVVGGVLPHTFQWSSVPDNANLVNNLCADPYSLTVTDANGCSMTWSGQINEPDEFIISLEETNPVSCNGGDDGIATLTTNGTPIDIIWNTGGTSTELTNLSATTYSVTVTNSDNCTAEASININEPLSAISSVISITSDISCNGESDAIISIAASGGAGFTYVWSNGLTGDELENLGPGAYQVTITDQNGCEAFDEVILSEPSLMSADLTTIEVNCLDGENSGGILVDTVIGGSGSYLYSLNVSTFGTTPEFLGLEAGAYEVFIQDANGCVESFSTLVDSPGEIEVDLGDDFTLDLGESTILEAFTTSQNPIFDWSIDSCIGCPEVQIMPVEAGMYAVTVTDSLSGCSATDEIIVMIDKQRDVFIPNVFSPNYDGTNDVFKVFVGPSVAQINSFRVFSRWGGVMFERTDIMPNEDIGWDGTIKGKDAPEGVYVYIMEIEFVDGLTRLYRGDVSMVR